MNKCFTTIGVYISGRIEPSYSDCPEFPKNIKRKRKSNMSNYTYEEAIAAAANYGLEEEVKYLMDHGFTPDEALREWDCEPEDFVFNNSEKVDKATFEDDTY